MRIHFYLPIEPFSVNGMYSRDRRFKTSKYKDWEMKLVHALSGQVPQTRLALLREAFDSTQHAFICKFTAYYPAFYTQKNEISAHTEDLSNWEKPLLDVLFLPKYHVLPSPYGCKNINTDDKHVVRLTSSKLPTNSEQTHVKIEICLVPKPKQT